MSEVAPTPAHDLSGWESAIEATAGRVREVLLQHAGLAHASADQAADETRRLSWHLLVAREESLSTDPATSRGVPVRRAALLVAAEALRQHGVRPPTPSQATPIPSGLDAEILIGALKEVIPGRRSPVAFHLRGYTVEEMMAIYGVSAGAMKDRVSLALATFRDSLHRRAERMNQPRWSQALEANPIAATFGMLREGTEMNNRGHCVGAADLAEALNGSHFRGGRENAFDHACLCDPCGAEFRALVALRRQLPTGAEQSIAEAEKLGLRRAARGRADLRPLLADSPGPGKPRRLWPWLVLGSVVALGGGRGLAAAAAPAAGKGDAPKAAASSTPPDSGDPWKITDPHGEYDDISFTTEEGTWLALDVHPDGQRLVFSLLGDLYLLPIAGGTAQRITSGTAYDVQPRFSPDGKWIAFASDRGGLENLWICDLEGKNARQISTEKKATVNSPAWAPGGDWLLGRKRLTDASSLGTVEFWMWHLKGGQGVQVTKRDEEPDVADPEFAADERFVYYTARGARFRYNRNPDEGIWQIKRYDRRTGQAVPLTGDSGGAVAPTLSPDGRTLAYVRRDRTTTVLERLDLATGKAQRIASGVERDGQEGFAFHGLFPGFAWTPDGKGIVATADGKIWRFDALTGARSAIPFNATVEQRVTRAARTPHAIAPDQERIRVVRWPMESPDGKRLVFSGAGHLYAMDLPGGKPSRLTDFTALEYAPSYSADGGKIAFITWDDKVGGHVWTLDVAPGSTPRRITAVPGQYANPSFSADGSKIVYLRGSGLPFREGDLSSELWHEIHWASATGGEGHYVIGTANRGPNRRMARPLFSIDGERIFYCEDAPGDKPTDVPKTVLVSVQLDGTDRREHLRFAKAEEAVVSPDGRWVAYSEQNDAYVTAMPAMGAKPIEVSADGALPVGRLTDSGGEWMNWADGGRTVTWSFGPIYHRISLEKAMPTPEPEAEKTKDEPGDKKGKKGKDAPKAEDDKKKEPKLPESQAIEIVLELPRARPVETVAYRGARIVSMKGDEVIDRGTIVVTGDRITAIGADGSVAVPAGTKVVDLSGSSVIPGLFDEHAHLHYSTLDIFPQRPWKYLANLAYGVTSTHDPSASTQEVFGQAEMVEAGIVTGPRIFSTGYIIYGADTPGSAPIESLDDARHHLRRLKSLGAFSVKSYMQPRRDVRQWILQAAREEGMMVVPEGGGDLEMDMTFILDGHTTIEHALPITPLRNDVVTLLARSKTAYTPTLLVAYGGIEGDFWYFQHYDVWKDEKLLKHVPRWVIDPLTRRRLMAPEDDFHHIDVAASAKKVLDAGGTVCLGAHGQMQGIGPHWEMWSFVQGGMTPLEAIRAATLAPARTLGLDQQLGSLEPGKLADFVVMARNPLEKIQNSDSVTLVVKNGQTYRPDDLARE
jgi:Tol biopolymer transport system component/imidazolonepropionase-like amidohydrolase